jgi:hypothetical protein
MLIFDSSRNFIFISYKGKKDMVLMVQVNFYSNKTNLYFLLFFVFIFLFLLHICHSAALISMHWIISIDAV